MGVPRERAGPWGLAAQLFSTDGLRHGPRLPQPRRNCGYTRRVRCVAPNPLMEMIMAFVTADVVATPGEETPFKVVFKQGETVLIEWEVNSQQEGETQII